MTRQSMLIYWDQSYKLYFIVVSFRAIDGSWQQPTFQIWSSFAHIYTC